VGSPRLVPVEGNPFAQTAPAPEALPPQSFGGGQPRLVPVEGNPFEEPKTEEAAPAPAEKSFLDPLTKTASNFMPSLAQELNKIWTGGKQMVQDPVGTADHIARMAITSSPFYGNGKLFDHLGWIAKKAGMDPEAVDAALAHLNEPKSEYVKQLTEDYGGVENFKKTLEEKPAQVLFDLSGLLTGAGAGLKGAASGAIQAGKVPSTAAKVAGKVGTIADKVGEFTDPVSLGLKGVEGAGKLATANLGVSTGAGGASLKEAARTGFVGGQEGANFLRAFNKGVAPDEILGMAQSNIGAVKKEMMDAYAKRKNDPNFGWVNDPNAVNFAPITQAWKDTVDSLTSKSGQRKVGDAEWGQIQKVGEVVSEWEQKGLRSVDDIDALKQRIRAIYPDGEAPQLRRVVTKMANAVGNTLNAVPGYKAAMKDYHKVSDQLWEVEKAFATGEKSSMQTALSKLQSVMRDGAQTQYGLRNKLLGDIEAQGGQGSVRPFLAGSNLSDLEPRGLARAGHGTGSGALLGTVLGGPVGAIAGGAAGLVTSSPRIVGGAYHGAGRAAGAPAASYNRFMPDRLKGLLGGEMAPETPYRAFGRGPRQVGRILGTNDETNGEAPFRAGGYLRSKAAR
jgi:hypothetical protein